MNPPSVGKLKPYEFTPFLIIAATLALPLIAKAQNKRPGPVQTLMLVRDWEPQSGKLVGWLPMHQVTIELEALGNPSDLHFIKNDVLKLNWPLHLTATGGTGEVEITPPTHTFQGRSWLPAKRDPNFVFIAGRYYVIRRIVFGESTRSLGSGNTSATNLLGREKVD